MGARQPSTFTQESRRKQITEATIECLARDGWHGTTLATIAAEAGISRGLLSYHFNDRDGLYEAVLESVVADVIGQGAIRIQRAVDNATTAVDKLSAYIAENLRFIAENRRDMAALAEIMPNFGRQGAKRRFDTQDEEPIIAGTAAIFDHGVSTGEFRPVDARLTAYFLRRCIDGAAHRITTEPEFDAEPYAAELTEFFLQGVRA